MITITGNTYPVREKLKAIGARWNRAKQGWDVPDAKAEEAQAIVASVPKQCGTRSNHGRGVRKPRTCKTCGDRINYGVFCGKCEFGR